MKVTKESIWLVIEVIMAGYMIISSCNKPLVLQAAINKSSDNKPSVFKPVTAVDENTAFIK
ncbi:MAG: hypothetical protein H7320_11065 [Ferruginibacter sp.]|nr:hypothetical protein [Ferruginibacter sp.]